MPSRSRARKSSNVAIVLSGIFPGLGQMYNEDWAKGIVLFIVSVILDATLLPEGYWVIIQGDVPLTGKLYLRIALVALFRIVVIIDADRSVKQRNAAVSSLSSRAD